MQLSWTPTSLVASASLVMTSPLGVGVDLRCSTLRGGRGVLPWGPAGLAAEDRWWAAWPLALPAPAAVAVAVAVAAPVPLFPAEVTWAAAGATAVGATASLPATGLQSRHQKIRARVQSSLYLHAPTTLVKTPRQS